MDSQPSTGSTGTPKRVVILGGGPAGVAASYWLSHPEQNGQYAVTLYTLGWRLGGKCASGRNAAQNNSIEEHGLHMLMGCYQNGFATMRSCYLDWRKIKPDPSNMFQVWTDAFLPQRLISMMQADNSVSPPSWAPWNFDFPQLEGEPGDGPLVAGSEPHPLTPDELLLITMGDWLVANTPTDANYYLPLKAAMAAVHGLFVTASTNTSQAITDLNAAAAAVHQHPASVPAAQCPPDSAEAVQWPGWQEIWILADIGVALAKGYILDLYNKGPAGYAALNQLDFRYWLGTMGASAAAANSAPINTFYDLAFTKVEGNSNSAGSAAAGVTFRTLLEMGIGYRNAPLFKMAAGMGDTVFTPFYDVLTARGVDIRFFSRVTALTPGPSNTLEQIEISVQATTVSGAPYQPLTRITCANGKQLDVWPNQPDWAQLTDGAQLQEEGADFEYSGWTTSYGSVSLVAGQDFDIAISAMPPGALVPIGNALAQQVPAWNTALNEARSVGTQSLQLWLKPTIAGLGWNYGATVLTGYAEPYDSWGDMSQVISAECWPSGNSPGSIAYFCGTLQIMDGPVTLPQMEALVANEASSWMTADLPGIWPEIGGNPVTSPDIMQRFDQPNFDWSDTYVQTPAGNNVASRFDPSAPAGLTNFYAIGDWTLTRFSGGCFESAIESAMLASRGISGFPQSIKTA